MKRNIFKGLGLGTVGVLVSTASHAALTLPTSLDVGEAEAVAGLVVVAAAALWAIRKAIAFIGR